MNQFLFFCSKEKPRESRKNAVQSVDTIHTTQQQKGIYQIISKCEHWILSDSCYNGIFKSLLENNIERIY